MDRSKAKELWWDGTSESIYEDLKLISSLISLMRVHDVQPVAIWDKPGVREWKAHETRRRLTTRALCSARRTHEDERQERLGELRDALEEFTGFSQAEQEVIRQNLVQGRPWEDRDAIDLQQSPVLITQPDINHDQHALPEQAEMEDSSEDIIERITNMEETLRDVVNRYRASLPRAQTTPRTDLSPDVVEHLSELEELSESLSAAVASPAVGEVHKVMERDSVREFIDEKAGELLPADEFRESKRQRELTLEEGRIIEACLQFRPAVDAVTPLDTLEQAKRSSADSKEPSPSISAEPSPNPLDRLDTLILAAPVVRDIYERALFQPTAETHADCRDLLNKLGIPVLLAEAPFEAEGLATSLAAEGVVDWVGSEDSDVLALGGPLLKNLSTARLPLTTIHQEGLLARTGLSRAQFAELCVLMGNDACPRIRGIGPVACLKYLMKHGTIEAILDNEADVRDRIPDVEMYLRQVKGAREVFGRLPEISADVKRELQDTFEGMKGKRVEVEVVERWLEERHGIRFVDAEDQ